MTMETKLEQLEGAAEEAPRGSTEGKDTRKSQYVQIYLIWALKFLHRESEIKVSSFCKNDHAPLSKFKMQTGWASTMFRKTVMFKYPLGREASLTAKKKLGVPRGLPKPNTQECGARKHLKCVKAHPNGAETERAVQESVLGQRIALQSKCMSYLWTYTFLELWIQVHLQSFLVTSLPFSYWF